MRTSPHVRSLIQDLEAQQLLLAGDTAGALRRWEEATGRYSAHELIFGLTESLWPSRLEHAQVAANFGEYPTTREVHATFENMAGFVDQVAWPLMLRNRVRAEAADNNVGAARAAYEDLIELWAEPDGAGVTLLDELIAELSALIN